MLFCADTRCAASLPGGRSCSLGRLCSTTCCCVGPRCRKLTSTCPPTVLSSGPPRLFPGPPVHAHRGPSSSVSITKQAGVCWRCDNAWILRILLKSDVSRHWVLSCVVDTCESSNHFSLSSRTHGGCPRSSSLPSGGDPVAGKWAGMTRATSIWPCARLSLLLPSTYVQRPGQGAWGQRASEPHNTKSLGRWTAMCEAASGGHTEMSHEQETNLHFTKTWGRRLPCGSALINDTCLSIQADFYFLSRLESSGVLLCCYFGCEWDLFFFLLRFLFGFRRL